MEDGDISASEDLIDAFIVKENEREDHEKK
jgi:hypothetical protein